jgi:predicted ABC-type ATPase
MSGRPVILVLAGVNGAGKSSVGGALLREHGLTWHNPDAVARAAMTEAGLSLEEANAYAWEQGVTKLREAIDNCANFAFETTSCASTIPGLLIKAAETHDVKVWFCGLASVEMHIERVALRVAHGGHDIPEDKIRARWTASRANLVRLIPHLTTLQVFDNSESALPGEEIPAPQLVLALNHQEVTVPGRHDVNALAAVPEWAKAIVQAAFEATHAAN